MKLTKEDIDTIKYLGYPKKVDLSIGSYYIKKVNEKQIVRELIGSKLAPLFNLICPEFQVVEALGSYYLLSKDLNEIGKFTTARNIGITDFINGSLYQIILYLNLNNMYNISLEQDLISLFLFDLLLANFDRHNCNWGIINNTNIAILDNESILDANLVDEESIMNYCGLTSYKGFFTPIIEDKPQFIKDNLTSFITNYPNYKDYLSMLLDKLSLEIFNDIVDSLKEINVITVDGVKTIKLSNLEELKNIYAYNYQILEQVEREYNHAR